MLQIPVGFSSTFLFQGRNFSTVLDEFPPRLAPETALVLGISREGTEEINDLIADRLPKAFAESTAAMRVESAPSGGGRLLRVPDEAGAPCAAVVDDLKRLVGRLAANNDPDLHETFNNHVLRNTFRPPVYPGLYTISEKADGGLRFHRSEEEGHGSKLIIMDPDHPAYAGLRKLLQ